MLDVVRDNIRYQLEIELRDALFNLSDEMEYKVKELIAQNKDDELEIKDIARTAFSTVLDEINLNFKLGHIQ